MSEESTRTAAPDQVRASWDEWEQLREALAQLQRQVIEATAPEPTSTYHGGGRSILDGSNSSW
jgi:hypothetical protein